MKIKKNPFDYSDLKISIPYKPKLAKEMDETELSRNIAFVNLIKWLNVGESLLGVSLNEEMVSHKAMMNYVDLEAGDIAQYLEMYDGVPFKYSLDPKHSESRELGELKITVNI